MSEDRKSSGPADKAKDAMTGALSRERSATESPPVRQHNPGDRGLNPGQKGPAQPDLPSDSGR